MILAVEALPLTLMGGPKTGRRVRQIKEIINKMVKGARTTTEHWEASPFLKSVLWDSCNQ
eukprot:8654397-Lingulodinium_polyedra.AAC.1